MWGLIVSVPDHCLSFYFSLNIPKFIQKNLNDKNIIAIFGVIGQNFGPIYFIALDYSSTEL